MRVMSSGADLTSRHVELTRAARGGPGAVGVALLAGSIFVVLIFIAWAALRLAP